MFKKKTVTATCTIVVLLTIIGVSFGVARRHKAKHGHPARRAVLWSEPNDLRRRNLYLGPGGEAMRPDLRRVTLIKEEPKTGYSRKYRVMDASGREWVAKVGKEAQSETAATRLLWGSGYYTDVDYLVPSVRVEGLNKTLTNVRFGARPKDEKRSDGWKWKTNPFVGKREFQGLKVMMALLNNWDTKDANNRIVVSQNKDGQKEERYVVHDVGASFGKKMNWFERNLLFKRDRNNPKGYAQARLVNDARGDTVRLNYWSKNRKVLKDVRVEDARWMGQVLSRLSPQQIEDAFRAANYSPEQVRQMSRAVRERIKELNNLPRSSQLARQ
ncbi:MAG: hypothetical protein JWM21_2718 [Acidobacteria bacterium]|nr:hypothetical protein [Acidobacteriota bacterium]